MKLRVTQSILSCFFAFFTMGVSAQSLEDAVVNHPSYKRTKVLILGSFHFSNPGLDTYKEAFGFDPMTKEHQTEIQEVVDLLSKFQPTKIALEFPYSRNDRYDSLYSEFLDGNFALRSNEIYQLGFRLAKKNGLKTVFGIDAWGKSYQAFANMTQDEYLSKKSELIQTGLQAKPNTTMWWPSYEKMFRYEDSLKSVLHLKSYLNYLNSDNLSLQHGIYLVDEFKLGIGQDDNYFGADSRTRWYNRNLRILHNIYRVIEKEDDRVLLIIGAGHLPLLTSMIQASPELKLIDAKDYLAPGK